MKARFAVVAAIGLALNAVFAAEINPPVNGKFFYSDFQIDGSRGFHEMNLYTVGTNQHFWTMITPEVGYIGLYHKSCNGCPSSTKWDSNDLTSTTKDDRLVLFDKKQVKETQIKSTLVKDQDLQVFFQKFGRKTQLKFNVFAVTEMNPSVDQIWHGFIGIQPYSADPANKESNFMW